MPPTTQPLSNIIDYDSNSVLNVPVAGGETIYRGAMVCYDADGDGTPADDTGPVIGFAIETVANTTANGGGSDGDMFVKVARIGRAVYNGSSTLAAAVQTGVNTVCYATDDQTVTHTAGTDIAGRVFQAENINARHGMTNPVVVQFSLAA